MRRYGERTLLETGKMLDFPRNYAFPYKPAKAQFENNNAITARIQGVADSSFDMRYTTFGMTSNGDSAGGRHGSRHPRDKPGLGNDRISRG
jgi:hypothetical protein